MNLQIDGQTQTLITLVDFRKAWQLPDAFSMTYFEPEERTGLGKLDNAGDLLNQVKETMINSVSTKVSMADLFDEVARLAVYFQQTLTTVNPQIGLSQIEVDFAQAGFEDILRAVTDQLVRLSFEAPPPQLCHQFDFNTVYNIWLNTGVRTASTENVFSHNHQTFIVQVIYNPYGRTGLRVTVEDQAHYVLDTSFACPAANYMKTLSEAVAAQLCIAFGRSLA